MTKIHGKIILTIILIICAALLAFAMADNQNLRQKNMALREALEAANLREETHVCPVPEPEDTATEETEPETAEVETNCAPVEVAQTATTTLADEEVPEGLIWLEGVTVSHYDTCVQCCGKTDGIGSSGRKVIPNYSVAVDPNVIPLGSDVVIMFDNGETLLCRADDTGGGINGSRIDLCVATHAEASAKGLRKANVGFTPPVELK